MSAIDLIINLAAILVIPAAIFSFWKIAQREEFNDLRQSGQKMNLNIYNLYSGSQRAADDPLREAHVKMARIGFLHWLFILLGFLLVFVFGILAVVLSGGS